MPLHDYKCLCGHEVPDVYHKMHSEAPELCPKCGKAMDRVPALAHTDMKEFHTPITMFSIGLNSPEEIRAFKQKCPDVEVNEDPEHPDWGLPIARSRKQKKQALKAMGYRETN